MISVIIVTYNRLNAIEHCIRAVLDQPEKKEIIIIDNCSGDNTAEILKNKYGDRIKLIRNEFKENLAYCKNIGARQAQGGIIAFTDDDCIPALNWLARILLCFNLGNCDILAGPVRLEKKLHFPWWWQPSLNWAIGIAEIGSKKFLPLGSNLAFKKDVYMEIESLLKKRPADKEIIYSEENFRIITAIKKGYKVRLDGSLIVYHSIGQERLSFKYLIKRGWLEGKHWALNERTPKVLTTRIFALLLNPLKFILTLDFNRLLRCIVSAAYIITFFKNYAHSH
ncbi:MAG: glycosyltransferase [Candidatus Omnitrophota bacterium]|jgi:glycosyltransferase involved in cell wall biosynthesis